MLLYRRKLTKNSRLDTHPGRDSGSSLRADSRMGRTLCDCSGVICVPVPGSVPAATGDVPKTSAVSQWPERYPRIPTYPRAKAHQSNAALRYGSAGNRAEQDDPELRSTPAGQALPLEVRLVEWGLTGGYCNARDPAEADVTVYFTNLYPTRCTVRMCRGSAGDLSSF